MKITIQPTDKLVTLVDGDNEMPARLWEGTTENGIPVHCWVTRVSVKVTHDQAAFERELQAKPFLMASADFAAIPNRLIL